MSDLQRIEIRIYSKPGCHLCEEAEKAVRTFEHRFPLDIHVVDISESAALMERYGVEIPVVFISGEKCFRHRVNPAGLERRLKAEVAKRL
ncbi:MAG: glutaredoxin family protein [Planctomycetes bacterium]|nr:glutaredoxin family protein [Planctomycetota bacterium]